MTRITDQLTLISTIQQGEGWLSQEGIVTDWYHAECAARNWSNFFRNWEAGWPTRWHPRHGNREVYCHICAGNSDRPHELRWEV